MRFLAAVSVASALACASTTSASSGGQPASAQACSGQQVPAMVDRGGDVYARPDGQSPVVGSVGNNTRVCADANISGFKFRRIKLADGREGYVDDEHVSLQ